MCSYVLKKQKLSKVFVYSKENYLFFYLEPMPNPFVKKIATFYQGADKITLPHFSIKNFLLHYKTQPSPSSLESAVSVYFHNLTKSKICSFGIFPNLLFTLYSYFLSCKNAEISNTVFFYLLTFKIKQETSSVLMQTSHPNTLEDDSFHLRKSEKSSF